MRSRSWCSLRRFGARDEIPHVKAGTIPALAVTSAQRAPALPDVPTVAESGYKGFEANTWTGVLVAALLKADTEKWARIVKESGVKVE